MPPTIIGKRARSPTPDGARDTQRSHKRSAPPPITLAATEGVVYHNLVEWINKSGRRRFVHRTSEAVSPKVLASRGRRLTRCPAARSTLARQEPEDDTQLRRFEVPSGSENWTFQFDQPRAERKVGNVRRDPFSPNHIA